jgi:hypothetical protein
MKCGGSCEYNYSHGDFFCICPDNAYLNSDGISCVVIEGRAYLSKIACFVVTKLQSVCAIYIRSSFKPTLFS